MEYFTAYSIRIYAALLERGFKPLSAVNNLTKPGFTAWIYPRTPALNKALISIFEEIERRKVGAKNG